MRTRIILTFLVAFAAASCDKGYRVRFANYYVERIDTVSISGTPFFSMVETEHVTDFKKITKGDHPVRFVSQGGRVFATSIHIPSTGTGDRTLQVDAISQVSVLEK